TAAELYPLSLHDALPICPNAAADHLDALVADVQRAADRHEVSFLATDIDRDGGKIILAAGAPASSGNDEEQMLLALREIVDGERSEEHTSELQSRSDLVC